MNKYAGGLTRVEIERHLTHEIDVIWIAKRKYVPQSEPRTSSFIDDCLHFLSSEFNENMQKIKFIAIDIPFLMKPLSLK